MSTNRDKESDKEIAYKKVDFIAKAEAFALTPEAAIERIVKEEVFVDNPELTKELEESVKDQVKLAADLGEAVSQLQEANDLIEFKNDQINTLAKQLEISTAQLEEYELVVKTNAQLTKNAVAAEKAIAQYKASKKDTAEIIKGLEAKNLKLKEAVKQLSE